MKYSLEDMKKGYEEMGAINLAIAEEFFHLENKVFGKVDECLYEMDSEDTKKDCRRDR